MIVQRGLRGMDGGRLKGGHIYAVISSNSAFASSSCSDAADMRSFFALVAERSAAEISVLKRPQSPIIWGEVILFAPNGGRSVDSSVTTGSYGKNFKIMLESCEWTSGEWSTLMSTLFFEVVLPKRR